MFGKKLINTNAGGGCTNTVDLYNPFPDGGGVALYQLNGDATDVSGNYNGTASNVTYGAGQFGQAGVFNGSTSDIVNTDLDVSASTGFSISLWLNSNLDNTWQRPIQFGSGQNALTIQKRGDNNNFRVIAENSGSAYIDLNSTVVGTNVWIHYVVTFSGSSCVIYKNGSSATSTSYSGGITHSDLYIGKRDTGTERFNGSIDQVRIFNRALRPYEVEALYTEEYCTPTIVPSEHFNTVLYTAATTNGTYDITGSSFQPDLIWVKNRDNVENHFLFDSVRGMTNMTDKFISSNRTVTEATASAAINGTTVTAINGGFRVVETSINSGELYFNGRTYVSWNFKAGGAAVTNTDGTITSQVSANTEAGFSVVGWTGNGSNNVTIGHGLESIPDMFIIKDRSVSQNWYIWQKDLAGDNYGLDFSSNPQAAFSFGTVGTKTASTITAVAGGNGISNLNTNGNNYIGYFFSEVEGFSNFGSYVGTGTTNGNTVITGFEPAFVMTKRIDAGSSWYIADNKRNPSNPRNLLLNANVAEVEIVGTGTSYFDFYENGFKITASTAELNASGGTYIYMAFAADPTTIEPSLEDSFNTVTWTGDNTATRNITGVGFQPDLVWYKKRSGVNQQIWADSVRGATKLIYSSLTAAEQTEPIDGYLSNFITDGFSVSQGTRNRDDVNASGQTYVSWNWKGAELPAINSNGSIPSVVSANPAAGFSIVSYTGNGANGTVGHGLGTTPNIVLTKRRNSTSNWSFNGNIGGLIYGTNKLVLQDTSAIVSDTNEVLAANSNNFTAGTSGAVGANGGTYIAYCFAEVAGFSKFGSYTGNAPAGGTGSTIPINCGFEPAFVMIKWTSGNVGYGAWGIWDNKRDTTNPNTKFLQANSSSAELDLAAYSIDFDANGFTVGATGNDITNISGNSYIYMAFANQF